MTEYWVSQGNKWCEFCKIFISSNPASIRNHELGQRHKDCVAQRLNNMRQEKVAKEKKDNNAIRVLQQIEEKAQRSYQKDLTTFGEAKDNTPTIPGEWEYDSSSGYYVNQGDGCHYDPNSGFYYTDALGKWVTREAALAALRASSDPNQKKPVPQKLIMMPESGPTRVVSATLNPNRSMKGAPSSLAVNKRKRPDEKKPKKVSEEEIAALKAREAARKRVEQREKPLFGLYKH